MVIGPGGEDTGVKSHYISVAKPPKAGLGDCAYAFTEAKTRASELLIGWGVIGLCCGMGYHFVRTASRGKRK